MKTKPDLSFWKLWNLSFGFFGVQMAFALQTSQNSRIFETLGADPHNLSYFWILPPLMGMIVQPIVGSLSDKTWCKFGRRKPYLYIGTIIAAIVMFLFPNSGSFSFQAVGAIMAFGATMLMLLDTSLNMAMQPFKMMVGDMVNEKQKAKAYSIQSMLCNAGQVIGSLLPKLLAMIFIGGVATTSIASGGANEVPESLKWSFYIGAIAMIICVLYTGFTVNEFNPEQYAQMNNIDANPKQGKTNIIQLLKNAPSAFWQIALVQFFCWFAFMLMWTYTNGALAENIWGATDKSMPGFNEAGDWVGVVFAVQSIASVLWAITMPFFKSTKVAYSTSLILGGIGFISTLFIQDQYLICGSFALIGCGWAAMLAMPFAMLTNSLSGKSIGTYLGLFNCTICLPQIVASLVGGLLLTLFGGERIFMLVLAGFLLIIGAASVFFIKETSAEKK